MLGEDEEANGSQESDDVESLAEYRLVKNQLFGSYLARMLVLLDDAALDERQDEFEVLGHQRLRGQQLTWQEELWELLEKFEEEPARLDAVVPSLVAKLSGLLQLTAAHDSGRLPSAAQRQVYALLYTAIKIRGRRATLVHLPHHVDLVRPLAARLQALPGHCHDDNRYYWQTRYVLLLWLSIAVLTPFDLRLLAPLPDVVSELTASNDELPTSNNELPTSNSELPISNSNLLGQLITLAMRSLDDRGPARRAASLVLARLFCRPDCSSEAFARFLQWCAHCLQSCNGGQSVGVLIALAYLLKIGDRDRWLRPHFAAPLVQQLAGHCCAIDGDSDVARLCCKVLHRLALVFLPQRLPSWRYTRPNLYLFGVRNTAAANDSDSDDTAPSDETLDLIEQTVGRLLSTLHDSRADNRYTAAKCLGELTGRLPRDLACDIVSEVVALLGSQCAGDQPRQHGTALHAWHGALLAVAELARPGLLLPDRLAATVPAVIAALGFDQRLGAMRLGANVRDAACYTAWCFARCYAADVMAPYVDALELSLLVCSLFDREVNCRRAAAAAFQEIVGRLVGHSSDSKTSGIAIIQLVNFYSVGNRCDTFAVIAPRIAAAHPSLLLPFLRHLVAHKVASWDEQVRQLAADAIALLVAQTVRTSSNDDSLRRLVEADVLAPLLDMTRGKDVLARHGAILALAELCKQLQPLAARVLDLLSADAVAALTGVAYAVEVERMWVGTQGKLVRRATCRLIRWLSELALPLATKPPPSASSRFAGRPGSAKPPPRVYLDFLQDSLKHPDDDIETEAAAAMAAFSARYMRDRMQTAAAVSLVKQYQAAVLSDPNIVAKRGFALGLGCLDLDILTRDPAVFNETFALLLDVADYRTGSRRRPAATSSSSSSSPSPNVSRAFDADTRRNAILSLSSLVMRLIAARPAAVPDVDSKVQAVVATLLEELRDFTVDKRGDVGSWAREASAEALEQLLGQGQLSVQQIGAFVSELVVQIGERLDKLREVAGRIVERLPADRLPDAQRPLLSLLRDAKWSDFADVAARLARVYVQLPPLRLFVVQGLAVSAHGTSKMNSHAAQQALDAVLNSEHIDTAEFAGHLVAALAAALSSGHKSKLAPLLKTAQELVLRGDFKQLQPTTGSDFAASLLQLLDKIAGRSSDIRLLCATVSTACRLLQFFVDPVRRDATLFVVNSLSHEYPRIRQHAAESLYTTLISSSWWPDPAAPILQALLQTKWLAETPDAYLNSVDALKNYFHHSIID